MKKMKKLGSFIVVLLLTIVATFGIAGCNSTKQSELPPMTDDVQQTIPDEGSTKNDDDSEEIERLLSRIEELESQLAEFDTKLAAAEKYICELELKIQKLIMQSLYEKPNLTEDDKLILDNHHVPTIDEDFKDNKILVILRDTYKNIIRFKDFEVVDKISKIVSISSYVREFNVIGDGTPIISGYGVVQTIMREQSETLALSYREYGNASLTLTLESHDKQKVLDIMDILNKLDMVLVCVPDYIYDIEFD